MSPESFNTGPSYSEAELLRMQRDAVRRVREMQNRAQAFEQARRASGESLIPRPTLTGNPIGSGLAGHGAAAPPAGSGSAVYGAVAVAPGTGGVGQAAPGGPGGPSAPGPVPGPAPNPAAADWGGDSPAPASRAPEAPGAAHNPANPAGPEGYGPPQGGPAYRGARQGGFFSRLQGGPQGGGQPPPESAPTGPSPGGGLLGSLSGLGSLFSGQGIAGIGEGLNGLLDGLSEPVKGALSSPRVDNERLLIILLMLLVFFRDEYDNMLLLALGYLLF